MKTLARKEDRSEICQRLAKIDSNDVPLWGTMSVGEMLCHLRGAFMIAAGEQPAGIVEMPLPRAVMKWGALWSPIAWPHNVQTVPELKRENVAPPSTFACDHAEMLAAMNRFLARENRTAHAMFGSMEPSDWMRWGYLHTDHHLRQFGR